MDTAQIKVGVNNSSKRIDLGIMQLSEEFSGGSLKHGGSLSVEFGAHGVNYRPFGPDGKGQ
ncbi:hypothetical protein PLUA15_140055 [Pseudomonas lundensis]|uniref:Uncharacterized protein n=1 Tax=Pseudomonas lundensis TaxID=86185 RepID=A0AAX2H2X7_9PSED|nr:hypothetical protein PLUA15_140055 [Pseudomonas lundensis]